MIRRTGIKIRIANYHGWAWTAQPVSPSHNASIAAYLAEYGVPWEGELIQSQDDRESAIEHYDLTPAMVRDIDHGWPVVRIIDPWVYLNHVGYDASDRCKL